MKYRGARPALSGAFPQNREAASISGMGSEPGNLVRVRFAALPLVTDYSTTLSLCPAHIWNSGALAGIAPAALGVTGRPHGPDASALAAATLGLVSRRTSTCSYPAQTAGEVNIG